MLGVRRRLTPGVEITGDRIQFRDEDFETYVRDQVARPTLPLPTYGSRELLYTLLRGTRAAAHVADHHFATPLPRPARDGPRRGRPGRDRQRFRREQVQGRRLDLARSPRSPPAMRGSRRSVRPGPATRRPVEHAVRTGRDPPGPGRPLHQSTCSAHTCSSRTRAVARAAHMQLAAVLARNPHRSASAREALLDAEAWVDRWMALREGKARHSATHTGRSAAAAEALYRLDGVDATAYTWLRRWRPTRFIREAGRQLAARVAGSLGLAAVLDASGTTTAPVPPCMPCSWPTRRLRPLHPTPIGSPILSRR